MPYRPPLRPEAPILLKDGLLKDGLLEERTITAPVEVESVDRVWQWLRGWAARLELDDDLLQTMRLSAEEAATNIVLHAFPEAGSRPPFRVTLGTAGSLTLTFEDEGAPFDPTAYADDAGASSIEDAVIGGLGIRLLRGSTDDLRYERAGGTNRLVLSFGPWPREG